mgnify:CR=1 FL=1
MRGYTRGFVVHIVYNFIYYTSEEFFLYKITVDKWTIHHFTRQNELLTGFKVGHSSNFLYEGFAEKYFLGVYLHSKS